MKKKKAAAPEARFQVHESADCASEKIGARTRIWQFCVIGDGAVIGEDCNIGLGVFVETGAEIGDRVTVKSATQVWSQVQISNDVFVGPNVTFTNDKFPRSRRWPEEYSRTVIREGASLGANATILPGLTIGKYSMVGAGSVVTKDVPDFAIVVGNPARITGYVDDAGPAQTSSRAESSGENTDVFEFLKVDMTNFTDIRGNLSALELTESLDFEVRRTFIVNGVPTEQTRGAHAHRVCHQFLIAASGSLVVRVTDGVKSREFKLVANSFGVYVPPMFWASQSDFSADAALVVLASDPYDDHDYIRDFGEYLHERGLPID